MNPMNFDAFGTACQPFCCLATGFFKTGLRLAQEGVPANHDPHAGGVGEWATTCNMLCHIQGKKLVFSLGAELQPFFIFPQRILEGNGSFFMSARLVMHPIPGGTDLLSKSWSLSLVMPQEASEP